MQHIGALALQLVLHQLWVVIGSNSHRRRVGEVDPVVVASDRWQACVRGEDVNEFLQ
jgi:hypothetical protein